MQQRDYSFFNCTSLKGDGYNYRYMDCLSGPGYIYAFTSDNSISYTDLTNCTKLYNLSSVPLDTLENTLHLNWSTPDSGQCERQGKFCRRKNNSASLEIECYDKPKSKEGMVFVTRFSVHFETIGSFSDNNEEWSHEQ
ncbi:hypothetical protein SADUNF_Sadunf15G0016500 [Salix dunnii]|uniref:RING-type E3 ubiquitin transferase n=1 Tax=Salix dunnii TaxID=1413687 RepID=A0A835JHQ7_9ROSI|nr:hypothetical protein SADUNF_Sadunf15G0016500 [Salix dunnii]